MSLLAPPLNAYLFQAEVVAAYPDARVIDVKWIDLSIIKRAVRVVQPSDSYSFPSIGEAGLVIGSETTAFYYLGKIEFGYVKKLDPTVINPATKQPWYVQAVDAGETLISNVMNGVKFFIGNTGNFSLRALRDGIEYTQDRAGEPLRWLQLTAKAILASTQTTEVNIGAVIRAIIGLGSKIVLDAPDITTAAQEFRAIVYDSLTAKEKVRLHLGSIFDEPILSNTAPIPTLHTEAGPPGLAARVRALLRVCNKLGLELASIKMDEFGNVSINAPLPGTGNLAINAGTRIAVGGDVVSTIEPAVQGIKLANVFMAHTHSSPMGPTGIPIITVLPTDIGSLKVFIA